MIFHPLFQIRMIFDLMKYSIWMDTMEKLTKEQLEYLSSKNKDIKTSFEFSDVKISHIAILKLSEYIKSPASLEKLTGISRKTIISIINNENRHINSDSNFYLDIMKEFLTLIEYVKILDMDPHYKDDLIAYREHGLPYSTEYQNKKKNKKKMK